MAKCPLSPGGRLGWQARTLELWIAQKLALPQSEVHNSLERTCADNLGVESLDELGWNGLCAATLVEELGVVLQVKHQEDALLMVRRPVAVLM